MTALPPTPASLLDRLRHPGAGQAWSRFIDLYTPLLNHWARRLGVDQQDMADFLQDFFLLLLRKLPKFQYNPPNRFRGWLRTTFLNHWRMTGRKRRRALPVGGTDSLDHVAAEDTFSAEDGEYERFLVARAMDLMRGSFEEKTWKACWGVVVDDRPAAEVAAELELSVNAVYVAKSRVLRRLREELAGLMD